MAKTWILDTETKGTGAHIAPIPGRGERRPPEPPLSTVVLGPPHGARGEKTAPEARRETQRFKVVEVMTGRILAEDGDVGEVVDLLEGMRSVVDARIYVRSSSAAPWRLLSVAEQRALWGFRGRRRHGPGPVAATA